MAGSTPTHARVARHGRRWHGGSAAVTPADMASAYATFAAGGIQRDRHFVQKVTNASGEVAYEANIPATRLSEEATLSSSGPDLTEG